MSDTGGVDRDLSKRDRGFPDLATDEQAQPRWYPREDDRGNRAGSTLAAIIVVVLLVAVVLFLVSR